MIRAALLVLLAAAAPALLHAQEPADAPSPAPQPVPPLFEDHDPLEITLWADFGSDKRLQFSVLHHDAEQDTDYASDPSVTNEPLRSVRAAFAWRWWNRIRYST